MEDNTLKVIASIFSITIIEAIALLSGVDGSILSLSIGSIAALGGYVAGSKKEEIKQYITESLKA